MPACFLAERSDSRVGHARSPSADLTEGPLPIAGPVFGSGHEVDRQVGLRPRCEVQWADGEEEQKQHGGILSAISCPRRSSGSRCPAGPSDHGQLRRGAVCAAECGQGRGGGGHENRSWRNPPARGALEVGRGSARAVRHSLRSRGLRGRLASLGPGRGVQDSEPGAHAVVPLYRLREVGPAPGTVLPGPRAAFAERTSHHRPELQDLGGQGGCDCRSFRQKVDAWFTWIVNRRRWGLVAQVVDELAEATLGDRLSGRPEADRDRMLQTALPYPRARVDWLPGYPLGSGEGPPLMREPTTTSTAPKARLTGGPARAYLAARRDGALLDRESGAYSGRT